MQNSHLYLNFSKFKNCHKVTKTQRFHEGLNTSFVKPSCVLVVENQKSRFKLTNTLTYVY